jgi:hypothetical protein
MPVIDQLQKRPSVAFWLPWGVDVIVALVFIYFFVVGIGDGSVDSFNIVLWLVILCASAAVVGGSLALRASGHPVLAIALVTIVAVPSLLIGLLFLALLFTPAH